jgi:hypothetical protein
MLSLERLETLAEQCRTLEESNREVDALVTLATLARPTANPRIWTLIEKPSQPVCMTWDKQFDEKLMARLRRSDDFEEQEVLHFKFDEGVWLHFVSRTVPEFTSDVSMGLQYLPIIAPSFPKWKMDSSGFVTLWSEAHKENIIFENTIPAISMTGAILKAKIFELRDLNERDSVRD